MPETRACLEALRAERAQSSDNYADNYSPEILKLVCGGGHPAESYRQNPAMPPLQAMHKNTAASPRSTATYFLLMEELSYRR